MTKITFLIPTIATAFLAVSCLDARIGVSDPALATSPESLHASAEFLPGTDDGVRKIVVKSNRSWYAHLNDALNPIPADSLVDWAELDVRDHFNLTGVEDEVTLTVTFSRNYSEEKVSGVLDFYSEGRKFLSVPVSQDAAVYRLKCTPDRSEAFCSTDTLKIAVDCNTSWTAEVAPGSTADVVIDTDSGFDPDTVLVCFASNKDTEKEKTAAVVFRSGALSDTVYLTQGKAIPYLSLASGNDSTLRTCSTAGKLMIHTNCRWTAYVKDDASLTDFTIENPSGEASDDAQAIAFNFRNDGDDPHLVKDATIVVKSPSLTDSLLFRFVQRSPLQIGFVPTGAFYADFDPALPTASSTETTTHSFTTSCDSTYTISNVLNYFKSNSLLFKHYASSQYCFFSFPGIPEMKLTRVIVTFKAHSSNKTFQAAVTDSDGTKVSETKSFTVSSTGDTVEFELQEPVAGKEYRLKASANKNCFINLITLVYE